MAVRENLSGKVVVITGASSGMGEACARRFAQAGCSLVLHGRDQGRLEAAVKAVETLGARCVSFSGDLRHYEQHQRLVERAVDAFAQVDILVNNAGFGLCKPFLDSTVEELDNQIDANLKSVIYGCHAVLPHMLKRRQGLIINLGSIASTRHFPQFAAYTAAKWGVLGFSRSLYGEVRQQGIRLSVVCPAAVNTRFLDTAGLTPSPWPVDAMIQSEDIADIIYTIAALPDRVVIEDVVVWPQCQAT